MPGTNPDRIVQLLEFAELHTAPWNTNAARIGLSSTQANAYADATALARQKYTAAQTIRQQAKVATQEQNEAVSALREVNSNLLRVIRAFALEQDKPAEVYNLAEIPPPAVPAPIGPPNAAYELRATLAITEGGIQLKWKAKQPAGTNGVVYRVERSIGQGGAWNLVGLTGGKTSIDSTIPAGTSRVLYRVVAQRGSLTSPASDVIDIRFATGPGEAAITVSTVGKDGGSVRLAA
jgi:hypothetical protein